MGIISTSLIKRSVKFFVTTILLGIILPGIVTSVSAATKTATISANVAYSAIVWSPAGAPAAGDDVTLTCNGTFSVTGIPSAIPTTGSFASLTIAGTGTLTLTGSTSTIWTTKLVCNANTTLSSASFTAAAMSSTTSSVAASKTLTVPASCFVPIGSGGVLTVSGIIAVNGNATGLLTTAASQVVVASGGSVIYTLTGQACQPAAMTVQSGGLLKVTATSASTISQFPSPAISMAGTLEIGGSITTVGGSNNISYTGTPTLKYTNTGAFAATVREWPATGPTTVIMTSTSGQTVTLGGAVSRSVTTLTMTSGNLTLAASNPLTVTGASTWSTNTITVASALTISGAITNNGTAVAVTTGTLDITGAGGTMSFNNTTAQINITSTGTFNLTSTNATPLTRSTNGIITAVGGSCTLAFTPASAQNWTIPAGLLSGTFALANLTLDMGTTGSLTLNNTTDFTVATSFNLTSGKTILNTGNIQLAGGCNFTGTPGVNNMIVTASTGVFKRTINSNGVAYTFPIGENTGTAEYSGFTVNFSSGAAGQVVGFRVTDADPTNIPSGATNYISRYWTSFFSGSTTYTYTMNLPYNGTTGDITGSTESVMNSAYKSSTTWNRVATVDATNNLVPFVAATQTTAPFSTGNQFTAIEIPCATPTAPATFTLTSANTTAVPVTLAGSIGLSATTNVAGIIVFANTTNANPAPDGGVDYNVGDVLPSGAIVIYKGGTPATNMAWSYDASLTGGTDLTPNTLYYFKAHTYNSGGSCNTIYSSAFVSQNLMPSVTQSSTPTVATCSGSQSIAIPYTVVSGSPDQYNVVWDAAATSAGFANVPAGAAYAGGFSNLPITVTVPAGVATGTYTGKINSRNSSTGFDNYTQNGSTTTGLSTLTIIVVNNTGLAGTKTVGTGGDYATFNGPSGLFADINSKGLAGNLTVNVLSDITETTTTGLNQVASYCGGPFTITIQPASASLKTISGNVATALIQFSGADNVTVDGSFGGSGRYLRFRNINGTQANLASTFYFTNDATNITVQNCDIEGHTSNQSSGVINISTASSTGNDNITINNNKIHERTDVYSGYPISLIFSNGTVSAANSNNTISNNELFNFSSFGGGSTGRRAYAINVTATGNGGNWTISGNSIYNTSIEGSGSQTAISFLPGAASSSNTISNNYIGGSSVQCGTGGTFPYWENSWAPSSTINQLDLITVNCGNITIDGNTVKRVRNTGSDYSGVQVITIAGSTVATVSNNILGDLNAVQDDQILCGGGGISGGSFGGWIFGIYSTSSGLLTATNNMISYLWQYGAYQGGWVFGINQTGSGGLVATGNKLTGLICDGFTSDSYGIAVGSSNFSGVNISNNIIEVPYTLNAGYSSVGILVNGTALNGTISNNRVSGGSYNNNLATYFVDGIYLGGSGNWDVNNNVITLGNYNSPGLNTVTESTWNFANYNVWIDGIDDNLTGASSSLNCFYNTVAIGGSQTGSTGNFSYAFRRRPSTVDMPVLRNNIFINSRSGGTGSSHIAIGTNSATNWNSTTSNYNFLASANTASLGNYNGTLKTFATWQTTTTPSQDLNSTTAQTTTGASSASLINPAELLTDAINADGHIQTISPPAYAFISNIGTPVTVTTDIDGGTRNASTPDIGADEFTVTPNDAGVVTVIIPTPLCSGIQTVQATIRNYGSSNLTSVTVKWYVNNVLQATLTPSVNLATGASSTITLGTYNFPIGVTTYVVKAATSLPNGATDLITANDEAVTGTLAVGLSGTYTVGAGQQFATLTSAVDYANTYGLCGPTVFSLTDATYTAETYPIVVGSLTGSSSTNTLTIKPAAGVSPVVSGSSGANVALFAFSGSSNVIVDGSNTSGGTTKNLTLANGNTAGSTILFINGAQNNVVKNSVLQGVVSGLGVVSFTTSSSAGNSNNTVNNNDITKGATSPSYGVYNKGSVGFSNANNVVSGNRIFDFSLAGIDDEGYSTMTTYTGNEIFETANQTTSLTGFFPQATTILGFNFSGNYIHDLKTTATTNVYGIYLFDISTSVAATISNNMIDLNTPSTLALYGIYDNSAVSEQYNIYFNTVRISGTVSGASNSWAYNRNQTSTTNLRNNILINARTGGTGRHYAIRTLASVTAFTSDYNDIYSTGGTGNVFGNNGTATTADRATLAAWQTATAKDANSQNQLPVFTSSQLHIDNTNITNTTYLDGKGVAIAAIGTDYDGDVRCTTSCAGSSIPDIGADEFIMAGSSISTTVASYGPFCNNATNNISVGYTTTGTLTGTYYVQISNSSGVFTSTTTGPTIIGTGSGSSPISAVIPSGLAAGTGYKVRVINDNPVTYGTDNSNAFTINAPPAAITFTTASATNNNVTPCLVANTYTINAQAGYTYTWSVPVGWSAVSGGTTNQITVTPSLAAGNVNVSVSIAGCAVASAGLSTVPVTSPAAPVANSNTTPQTSGVSTTGFTANWGGVSGATDYFIDVSTSSSFSAPAVVASEGFENTVTLFTNSAGTFFNGNTASGDAPATAAFATAGTYSYGKVNGTATLTSNNINTSAYSNAELSFRLASHSVGSTGNGADAADIVTVEVSPNGGTNYYSTLRVLGASASNAYWGYDATGIASTAYDGNATPVDFQPAGSGLRTADGYSTITITNLPIASNMRVRITLLNNATGERWVMDEFAVTGSTTSTLPAYNNLQVSPFGTSQSVTGLTSGNTYYYRVRAANACGSSTNSNVVEVTTTVPAAPAIAVTSQAHNSTYAYGNQTVGTNTDHVFTITNSGTATLNISSINVSGTGFTLQGTAPTTVAQGGTATFTVRFTPNASASFTGSIVINNDATPGAYTINLTGTGVGAASSVIQAVSNSEATTVSSLTNGTITTNVQGTQVWKFRLYDGNGIASDGDGLPTVYNSWIITSGTGNTVPNWATVINDVKFFLGSSTTPLAGTFSVSGSSIAFTPSAGISVAQGAASFEEISMRITVDNPLAAGSDGQYLVFKINSADVTAASIATSSQLAAFAPASNSTKNQIAVTATGLVMNAPSTVNINTAFSITVTATDANGNIDINQSSAITLAQSSGAGTFSGGAVQNLVNGTFTFAGLSYNQVGTFGVSASGGSFSTVSATIICVSDPYQSFDNFNRTDNNLVGLPSSGGSTAWTEAGTGDGSRQRIEGNQLVLSNCNLIGGSAGNGFEQVVFDGTSKYSTVFNNANGSLTWAFNMRNSRSSPSGFDNTNTYGMAMVLGCNQSDFTSPSANGYAVIIGNASSPDPAKLVYFTGGLISNANITNLAVSTYTGETGYLSVQAVFNPCNGQWSLFVRNDGASAFASPVAGSLGTAVTGTNTTYTASDLKYFGMAWQHGASCSETATFDNLYIPNAPAVPSGLKIWNGSVVGGDWNTAANWSPCPGVPLSTDNVLIPSTSNNPVITGTSGVCKDLTINPGVQITINTGFTLNVGGDWSGSTTSTPATVTGAGKVILTGSTAQAVSGRTAFTTLHVTKTGGSTATLQANSFIDVTTAVELESGTLATGTGTLTFKSTGTNQIAVLDNFTAGYTGTLTGNITAERYYNATGTTNQHYMGSPVSTTLSQFGAGSSSGFVTPTATCSETQLASTSVYGSVFSYDQANGASCSLAGWKVEAGATAVAAAKGFAVTKNGAGTVTVTGAPNLASSYTQAGTNSGWSNSSLQGRPMTAGWVLVSNPYLAYLDFSTQGAPANFTSEVKVWRTTGAFAGTYQDLQPGEMIAPFQGFFVHSNATGSYPISGAKRTRSTAGSFHAQANDQQLSITAANTTTGLADITMVAFNNDATTQFDNDYDAQKIAGTLGRHTLYTVGANNLWMSKNVLHSITETSTVTMGFEPEVSGSYTFSFEGLNSFDPTSYITLEDRKLNTFYDVRNGDYSFTADSADQWERFVLHFTPAAQITTTDENCNALGNIIVTQPGTANWNYTITDNNNATIASGMLNETTPINTAAQTGTYVITLVDNNNYTVAKTVTVSGTAPVAAVFTPSVTVAETNQAVSFNSSSVATNYYWDFGDGTTATGQNAIHNYTDTGTYTVTLIVISEGGCSSTTTQTITVNQTATGITTLNNKAAINIWSNENKVYIDFSQMAKTDATIAIYNVLGQELVNEKFARSTIYNKALLNTEAAYVIVKVKNGDAVITKKVFIANVK